MELASRTEKRRKRCLVNPDSRQQQASGEIGLAVPAGRDQAAWLGAPVALRSSAINSVASEPNSAVATEPRG